MYTSMYEIFDDKAFRYHYPLSFDSRTKHYLQPKTHTRAFWYYGDTVELTFNLNIYHEEIDNTFLEGKQVVVTFFNWRKEIVYSEVFVKGVELDIEKKGTVTVVLSKQISKQVFKRGIYSCSVCIEDVNDDEDKEITTVLPTELCLFYVK